jgi:hypothetical protein
VKFIGEVGTFVKLALFFLILGLILGVVIAMSG